MSAELYSELLGVCAAALLFTSVLTVWHRSQRASIRALAVQGIALGGLVAVVAVDRGDAELMVVVVLVLALKGFILPWVLSRRPEPVSPALVRREQAEEVPILNPLAALVAAALLAVVAYAVTWPLVEHSPSPAAHAAPVGVAMVLIGFLVLVTRRRAITQLVGFLALDNGIATVAFLISGGVPILIEFGVSLDILLVTLILQVFSRRMREVFGDTDVDRMRELRD